MLRKDRGAFLVLVLSLAAVALGMAAWRAPVPRTTFNRELPVPCPNAAAPGFEGTAPDGLSLHYTLDGSEPNAGSPVWTMGTRATPDEHHAQRLIRAASSPQWRAPVPGPYADAVVVRARYCDEHGRCGPIAERTWPVRGQRLPMLSLVLPDGSLVDPDSGIYVLGHGVFRDREPAVQRYPRDQKWWKYPGNYQFRGKAWERSADLEVLEADGQRMWAGPVRVRINGNNTRGFPQHALRLVSEEPLSAAVLGAGRGTGHRALVLRAGGNDQDMAFLRDAVQHRLCEGLPFMTSGYEPCVLLVNGAYWGLHDLRERMDDREVARRIGVPRKQVTILADRAILYDGDEREVQRFTRMLGRIERMDPASPAFADSVDRYLDLDGFLQYMAAQLILGNADWPDQNVKYWRFTGAPDTPAGARDGRWRFIMGDSDQGLGSPVGPEFDHIARVLAKATPVPRLFKACLRSAPVRDRFRAIVEEQLNGPLSAQAMLATIDGLSARIRPEMPRHVARWRRPRTVEAWERDVEELRSFARLRGDHVRRQLDLHFPSRPGA